MELQALALIATAALVEAAAPAPSVTVSYTAITIGLAVIAAVMTAVVAIIRTTATVTAGVKDFKATVVSTALESAENKGRLQGHSDRIDILEVSIVQHEKRMDAFQEKQEDMVSGIGRDIHALAEKIK